MTFSPTVPAGGLAGLRLIDATYERQFELFGKSPGIERDVAAFRERAGSVLTAEEFVQDTQLLRVALGAFGLDDELPKRAFVRRILEQGTIDPTSFANRLSDPAWAKVSAALGFGDFGPALITEGARERIVEAYRVRQFERAVGDVDVNLRLALNFRREIAEVASSPNAETSGWFRVIGSEPLRTVVLGALGLPDSFAQLDLDTQRDRLETRAARVFGDASPAVFADPDVVEDAVRRFLLRTELESGPSASAPGATALTLLTGSSGLGAGAQAGLVLSSALPR